MDLTTLAAAALTTIHALSPVSAPHERLPGWDETQDQRSTRYASIAQDVAGAAVDACLTSPNQDTCQRWSVSALLGVANHESGFQPDVDIGPCYRGKDGKSPRCDGGRSVSMWQILTGGEEREVFAHDRKAAARRALRSISRSMGACRKAPNEERLSAYAGGRCDNHMGQRRARELWHDILRAQRSLDQAIARAGEVG
jgi:hypothetical protein